MNVHILVSKDDLLPILSAIQGITTRKSVLDVTSYAYIETNGSELTIKSTDMEIAYQASISVRQSNRGISSYDPISFLLNGKRFYELVKDFAPEIELKYDGTSCFIESAQVKAQLLARNPDDFPGMPQKIENIFAIETQKLCSTLDWTSSIASHSGINPAFQSVLIETEQTKLTVTATDGHCLAHVIYDLPSANKNSYKWLISKRAAYELKKILEDMKDQSVFIGTCPSYIVFSGAYFNFFAKLSTEKFPEYATILDMQGYYESTCNREHFVKLLRRINVMLGGRFLPAQFHISQQELCVHLSNKETGEIRDRVHLTKSSSHDTTTLLLYAPYISQGVSKMSGEEITFAIQSNKRPFMVKNNNEGIKFVYLVMPVLQS